MVEFFTIQGLTCLINIISFSTLTELYRMEGDQRFRLFAGLARSGTTMLQKALSHLPDTVTTRSLIVNRDASCPPEWSVFTDFTRLGVKNVIDRENIGARSHALCTAPLFRGPQDMVVCRPVFVIRDPLATYGSWMKQGWVNIELFLTAFRHFEEIVADAVDIQGHGLVVNYEELTRSPEIVLRKMLVHWGIDASPEVVQRLVNWPENFSLTDTTRGTELFDARRGAIIRGYSEKNLDTGVHATLSEGPQRIRYIEETFPVPTDEQTRIEDVCRDLFNRRLKSSSIVVPPPKRF